jgi:hypothetical protein
MPRRFAPKRVKRSYPGGNRLSSKPGRVGLHFAHPTTQPREDTAVLCPYREFCCNQAKNRETTHLRNWSFHQGNHSAERISAKEYGQLSGNMSGDS